MRITAPWSDSEVEQLRQLQGNPMFHGYTCPGGRDCRAPGHRLLVPTTEGWVCVCGDYRQDWAHVVDQRKPK